MAFLLSRERHQRWHRRRSFNVTVRALTPRFGRQHTRSVSEHNIASMQPGSWRLDGAVALAALAYSLLHHVPETASPAVFRPKLGASSTAVGSAPPPWDGPVSTKTTPRLVMATPAAKATVETSPANLAS
jgi:hypothetical protein